MPYDVTLRERPLGYAAEDATGIEGHPAKVIISEFTSSEDGELLISRLEGWPTTILSQCSPRAHLRPSEVDHMIAIIANDLDLFAE